MDTITVILLVTASLLGLLALIFMARWLGLRMELRNFREQINEIRTTDREQPIKVASFGAPSVELAREINLLVAELRDAVNHSEEEERRVRTIMAGVSHDFRTPLTAADGYLQLVEEMLCKLMPDIPDEKNPTDSEASPSPTGADIFADSCLLSELQEISDYLRIVSERVKYLRSLSDEFFEVTYLDARSDIPLTAVRLDSLLTEVILGQYRWIEAGNIRADIHIPEEQMIVAADRHYLERILENLFSNARKYARSFLEVSVDTSGDDHITFVMRNDMDSNQRMDADHIFEPFYRAKGRTGQGTGLGLYVVKELAEAMHFQVEGNVTEDVFELTVAMPKSPQASPHHDRNSSTSHNKG